MILNRPESPRSLVQKTHHNDVLAHIHRTNRHVRQNRRSHRPRRGQTWIACLPPSATGANRLLRLLFELGIYGVVVGWAAAIGGLTFATRAATATAARRVDLLADLIHRLLQRILGGAHALD